MPPTQLSRFRGTQGESPDSRLGSSGLRPPELEREEFLEWNANVSHLRRLAWPDGFVPQAEAHHHGFGLSPRDAEPIESGARQHLAHRRALRGVGGSLEDGNLPWQSGGPAKTAYIPPQRLSLKQHIPAVQSTALTPVAWAPPGVQPNTGPAVMGHSATTISGRVIVFGGEGEAGLSPSTALWVFNRETEGWSGAEHVVDSGPRMAYPIEPAGRFSPAFHSAVRLGERHILYWGGTCNFRQSELQSRRRECGLLPDKACDVCTQCRPTCGLSTWLTFGGPGTNRLVLSALCRRLATAT